MAGKIEIQPAAAEKIDCEMTIVAPQKALEEGGYIKVFTVKENAHAKHEYHAIAQMAYFQYQDEELSLRECQSPIKITTASDTIELQSGVVMYKLANGEFHVLVTGDVNRKKMLEAVYRYCTRWVRLDI